MLRKSAWPLHRACANRTNDAPDYDPLLARIEALAVLPAPLQLDWTVRRASSDAIQQAGSPTDARLVSCVGRGTVNLNLVMLHHHRNECAAWRARNLRTRSALPHSPG